MTQPRLADLTTLRVGGAIERLVDATSEAEIIAHIQAADAAGTPLLLLGAGSNLLASDDAFPGLVLRDARRTVSVQDDGVCGGAAVTASAGLLWDDLVERAVTEEWVGVEALSGIPGTVGATPVQNVGAYGAEVGDVVAAVRVWDRHESRVRTLAHSECQFGYRDSLLKRSMRGDGGDGATWHPSPRFIVLDVRFQFRFGAASAPVRYAQLAAALGVEVGARAPMTEVRAAVLALRASKGMLLDSADHDTWSAGSFFTNPVLSAAAAAVLPAGAPRYPTSDNAADPVKASAAWLIEHAGFGKGFALPDRPAASLSTKHTLALTNRGGASSADLLALARAVRAGVKDAFGVTLEPEPVLLGVTL